MMAASTNPENDMRFPPSCVAEIHPDVVVANGSRCTPPFAPAGVAPFIAGGQPRRADDNGEGAAGRAAEPVHDTVAAALRRRGARRGGPGRMSSGGVKAACARDWPGGSRGGCVS